jgi:hypothetical protein
MSYTSSPPSATMVCSGTALLCYISKDYLLINYIILLSSTVTFINEFFGEGSTICDNVMDSFVTKDKFIEAEVYCLNPIVLASTSTGWATKK